MWTTSSGSQSVSTRKGSSATIRHFFSQFPAGGRPARLLLDNIRTTSIQKKQDNCDTGQVICAARVPTSSISLSQYVAHVHAMSTILTNLSARGRWHSPLHVMALPADCTPRSPVRAWLSWVPHQLRLCRPPTSDGFCPRLRHTREPANAIHLHGLSGCCERERQGA